jgi:hypothetical protein
MKYLILALFSSAAFAMQAAPGTGEKSFDLMKCFSAKHGTVWGSFGHLMTSDSPELKYFATEIAVFAPDSVSRIRELNFKKAMELVDVSVRPGAASIRFSVEVEAGGEKLKRDHTITVLNWNRELKNAFVGNWKVVQNGVEVHDEVACTLN